MKMKSADKVRLIVDAVNKPNQKVLVFAPVDWRSYRGELWCVYKSDHGAMCLAGKSCIKFSNGSILMIVTKRTSAYAIQGHILNAVFVLDRSWLVAPCRNVILHRMLWSSGGPVIMYD